MKLVVFFALIVFSTATFASVTKTDSGFVSWTVKINTKKEGILKYSRTRLQINGSNSASEEELRTATIISLTSPIGGYSETKMNFEFSDERSVESVEKKIKELIAKDLKDIPLNGEESEVQVQNLLCKESGFIKKKLSCSAEFQHKQVLNSK